MWYLEAFCHDYSQVEKISARKGRGREWSDGKKLVSTRVGVKFDKEKRKHVPLRVLVFSKQHSEIRCRYLDRTKQQSIQLQKLSKDLTEEMRANKNKQTSTHTIQ